MTSPTNGPVRHIEQLMADLMPDQPKVHYVGKSKKTRAERIRAKKARRTNRRK
jgi:hypothetical protein